MDFIKSRNILSSDMESKQIPEIELYFPKFSKKQEKNMTQQEICIKCHGCCMYVTVPLDPPDNEESIQMYIWYLYHRNIEIYLDHNDQWQILMKTPCKHLLPTGYCSIYENRPKICKEYEPDNCSRTGKDYKILFKNSEEFIKYINKKKKSKKLI